MMTPAKTSMPRWIWRSHLKETAPSKAAGHVSNTQPSREKPLHTYSIHTQTQYFSVCVPMFPLKNVWQGKSLLLCSLNKQPGSQQFKLYHNNMITNISAFHYVIDQYVSQFYRPSRCKTTVLKTPKANILVHFMFAPWNSSIDHRERKWSANKPNSITLNTVRQVNFKLNLTS